MGVNKREFLAGVAALAASTDLAGAQPAKKPVTYGPQRKTTPHGMVKTTKLFKAPPGYVNALALAPEGIWLGQQKLSGKAAESYHLPEPTDLREAAWLVDWNGKLLKTVTTHSRNTSGMAYGNGCVWMGANAAPWGIFQVDMNSKELSHRQIPLSIDNNGGGCHGVKWHEGKLWIAALRLGGILRVDPTTWVPEVLIRVSSEEKPRLHDVAFDNEGNIWVVTGNNSASYAEGKPGLNKYDGKTGQLLMTVDLQPGSCDPHGLVWHDGHLVSCDAGLHPGWKAMESPTSGYIFSIELV